MFNPFKNPPVAPVAAPIEADPKAVEAESPEARNREALKLAQDEADKAFLVDMNIANMCQYRPSHGSGCALGVRAYFRARNGRDVDIRDKLLQLRDVMIRKMDYHSTQEMLQVIAGTWKKSDSSFATFLNPADTDVIEVKGCAILKKLEDTRDEMRREKEKLERDGLVEENDAERKRRDAEAQASQKTEKNTGDLPWQKAESDAPEHVFEWQREAGGAREAEEVGGTEAFTDFIAGQQPEIDRQKREQAAAIEADRLHREETEASRQEMNGYAASQGQLESLAVLGLLEGATEAEMKAAYRKQIGEHHSDRHEQDTPEQQKYHADMSTNLNQAKEALGF